MITRQTVFDAFLAALDAALAIPVHQWSRNVEDITDPSVADGVYVAPYGSRLDVPEGDGPSMEIGATTYERQFYFEVVVVGTDAAGEIASRRIMPVLDAVELALHDADIASGVCEISSHPDTSRFHEFYIPSHVGRCACVQLWCVRILESRG